MATRTKIERKGSVRIDPEDYSRLSRADFEKIRDVFRKYDALNAGNIKRSDLFDIIKGKSFVMFLHMKFSRS